MTLLLMHKFTDLDQDQQGSALFNNIGTVLLFHNVWIACSTILTEGSQMTQ